MGNKLTKEQVYGIETRWRNGHSAKMIAAEYGVYESAIYYWVRRLRNVGYILKRKRAGRKAIRIT